MHAHSHVVFLMVTLFAPPLAPISLFSPSIQITDSVGQSSNSLPDIVCGHPYEYIVKRKMGVWHAYAFHFEHEKESTCSCVTCP